MKTLQKILLCVFVAGGVFVAGAAHTAAYIDPSIVTYLISVISGLVVAGGAGVAIYWKRIKLWLRRRGNKDTQQASGVPAPPMARAVAHKNENLAD